MPVLELDEIEPSTGTDIYEWFREQLSQPFFVTDQSPAARLIVHGDVAPGTPLVRSEVVTDANAQERFVDHPVNEMAQNLLALSAVAALAIPGLRDMSTAEKANLRQYYRTVYRKG